MRTQQKWPMCAVLLLWPVICAPQVILSWDANQEADLAYYRIYYGYAPREYRYWFASPETTFTLENLNPGRYFFAVTAIDEAGNESSYSEEVSAVVPVLPAAEDTLPIYTWPAGKPLRFLLIFTDTLGTGQQINIEWRQFRANEDRGWTPLYLRQTGAAEPTDYWLHGDTLTINTVRLQQYNWQFQYRWQFRARVDSGVWVETRQAIQLVKPAELIEMRFLR